MHRILECPSCAAPLQYAGGSAPTIACAFCGNSIVVPSDWRPPQPPQVHPPYVHSSQLPPQSPPAYGRAFGYLAVRLITAGIVVVAIGGVSVLRLLTRHKLPSVNSSRGVSSSEVSPTVGNVDAEATGFAVPVLKFGTEGIGPGQFKDARSVAVDGAGNIYVGEYLQRRVQVFDSSGKFVTQWALGPRMEIARLAADRKGNVYIEADGMIYRFDGSTGAERGHLEFPTGYAFNDVACAADGGLVTSDFLSTDNITRFDAAGKTKFVIRNAVSAQSNTPEPHLCVAVDGLGNIYALSIFSNAVYKFSMDGKFLNKFGEEADAGSIAPKPGQFRAPQAIAVDGKGRVYVSDFYGIHVFDAGGQCIDRFRGGASGMVFDDQNNLLTVERTHVVKYAIKK